MRGGYGRIPVLDEISFAVAPSEVVGILGHNGMGKTTLLRTLMGELRATAGTAETNPLFSTAASVILINPAVQDSAVARRKPEDKSC